MATETDQILNFLGEQRNNAPAGSEHVFLQFEELFERKLWHELTEALVEFYKSEQSQAVRIPLYEVFISSFQNKINQLKLVTLGLIAASQCDSKQPTRSRWI